MKLADSSSMQATQTARIAKGAKVALATVLTSAALLVNPGVQAKEVINSKTGETYYEEEAVGFGIGAVVGGILAGPPGVVLSGTFGGLIGKVIGGEEEKEQLAARLNDSKSELLALQQALDEQKEELRLAKAALDNQTIQVATVEPIRFRNVQGEGVDSGSELQRLTSSLQFKTGSVSIEPHYFQQLDDIARALKDAPQLLLKLAGFSDRQGDADYNLELSRMRADAVKRYLVAKGIAEERIDTSAKGESQPLHAQQNHQGDFFDRRVMIELSTTEEAVASNH